MAELNKNYSYEKTRQFTNYIQHIHNLSNNYGSVYATAFANYSSPYKTNMTRVHFKYVPIDQFLPMREILHRTETEEDKV